MASWYNLTSVSNSSGVVALVQGTNAMMGGWLGVFMLMTGSLIILLAYLHSTYDLRKSLISTAFINFFLCLMLRSIALVPNMAIFISMILVAGSLCIPAGD